MDAHPRRHRRPRELALFAGAGGGLLGSLLLGWRTVGYVEIDDFCAGVLRQRIEDGWLHDAPIWDDVCTFDGTPWRGKVDVLTAGFPCQPYSIAGDQRGEDDDRDLWSETADVIGDVRPPLVLLENVPAIVSSGAIGRVLGRLDVLGYDAVWECLPAGAVGAPHRRDRWWCLAFDADADRSRLKMVAQSHRKTLRRSLRSQRRHHAMRLCADVADAEQSRRGGRSGQQRARGRTKSSDGSGSVANADRAGREELDAADQPRGPRSHSGRDAAPWSRSVGWPAEPEVGRLADGVADRVDRLRALGNGQVPQQMAVAWSLLGRRLRRLLGEQSTD